MLPPPTQSPGLRNRVLSNSFLSLSCHDLSVARAGQSDAHVSLLSVHLGLTFISPRLPRDIRLLPQAPLSHPPRSLHPPAQSIFLEQALIDPDLFSGSPLPAGQSPGYVRTLTALPELLPSSSCIQPSGGVWAGRPYGMLWALFLHSRLALTPAFLSVSEVLSLFSLSRARFRSILWEALPDSLAAESRPPSSTFRWCHVCSARTQLSQRHQSC